jgi:hypothetical protein
MKKLLILPIIFLSLAATVLADTYTGTLTYTLQTISTDFPLTPFGLAQRLLSSEEHSLTVQVSEDGSFSMPADQYQVDSTIFTIGVLDPTTSDFYNFIDMSVDTFEVQSEAGSYGIGHELVEGCHSYTVMTGGLPISAQFSPAWNVTGISAVNGQILAFYLLDNNVPLMPIVSMNLNVCYTVPEYLAVLNYTFDYDSEVPNGFSWNERGYWNIRVKKQDGEWKASLAHTHLESFFLPPLINVTHPGIVGSENLTAVKNAGSFTISLGEANSNAGKNHILSIETENDQTDTVVVVNQPFQNTAKMAISLLARRYGVNADLPIGTDAWVFVPTPTFSMSLNWSMFEITPDDSDVE